MEECTNEKYDQRSGHSAIAQVNNRNVNMAHTPSMYWHIPCPPKSVYVIGIPPVTVEVSIGKMQQLSNEIQKRMER